MPQVGNVQVRAILALFATAVLLMLPTVGFTDECDKVLGEWRWFVGGAVVFSEDHGAVFTPDPGVPLPQGKGRWTCDAGSGTYTIDWGNGVVDTLQIAQDGGRIAGTNMAGQAIWGTRPGAPAPTADCSQAAATTGPGACALLSPADLCQTLGKPFSEGESSRSRRQDICRFKSSDGFSDQVEINSSIATRGPDFFQQLRALKKDAIDLPEVGPNAYLVMDVHGKRLTVHIWHARRNVRLEMMGFSALSQPWKGDEKIAQATALSRKALQRSGEGSVPDLRDLLNPKN